MNSPSPGTGEGGARPAKPGGRVRGVRKKRVGAPTNDERQRALELRDRARAMRANPTPAERCLWSMLRHRRMPPAKFRRQHVIAPYIVDFACLERSLIIEADGSQHTDSRSDLRRDAYLSRLGFRILRFWNNGVIENPTGVFEVIYAALHTPHPPTAAQWVPPSPVTGEGLGDLNA
jgi:very-short-patch-repair endonuclease